VGERDSQLQGQEVLFPPLVNCGDPVACILAKLTTREHREEIRKIGTIGELCSMELSSVDSLPITSPKIPHTRAVLQEYKDLQEAQMGSEDTSS